MAVRPAAPSLEPDPLASTAEVSLPAHNSICVAELDARVDSIVPDSRPAPTPADLQREYDKLLAAFRISEALRDLDQVDRILERVVETMFDLFPATRTAILLAAPSGSMELAIARSRDESARGTFSISRTLVERSLAQNKAILTRDALQNVGTLSVIASSVNSAMTIPLISSEGTAGVLHVESTADHAPQPFSRRDLEIATGIGAQIALALHRVRLARKVQEEVEIRGRLGRFVGPDVLDQVVSDERFVMPGGQLRRATILFSDIRGFTCLSEGLEPGRVVDLLNEYFAEMVDIVFRHGGILDKFIGDAVMAFWGPPHTEQNAALKAVLAALDMQRALVDLNARRTGRGDPPIDVGIGLNTGDVLVGNIGSPRRLEYTVIGDPVNVASRLCGIAAGGEILISEKTRSTIGTGIRSQTLPPTRLKGKQVEVIPHRVLGPHRGAS